MLGLIDPERRERARRRRLAILCLGALGDARTAEELSACIGEPLEEGMEDARELGFCSREKNGRYIATGRGVFDVGVVLAGTDESVAAVQKLLPLAADEDRAFLLALASDPLGEGAARAATLSPASKLAPLARALRVIAGTEEEDPPNAAPELSRDVIAAVAAAAHVLGQTDAARALRWVRWALGERGMEGAITAAQGLLAAVVVQILYDSGEREQALAFAKRAQAALGDEESTFARILLATLEGHLLADLHRLRESRQAFTRVELQARGQGLLELCGVARIGFGTIAFREGATDTATELYRSALDLVLGSTRYEVLAIHCLAHAFAKQGRHPEAQRALSETLGALDSVAIRLSGYTNSIAYDVFMGDLSVAREKLQALEGFAPQSGHGRLSVALSRAYLAAGSARWEEALRHLDAVAREADSRPAFSVAAGALAATSHARLGELIAARESLTRASQVLTLHPHSRHAALIHVLDAEIALQEGDDARARRALRRALDAPQALRASDFAFRVRVAAHRLARKSKDVAEIEAAHGRAIAAYRELTHGLDATQLERFRAVGDRPAVLAELGLDAPGGPVARVPWLRGKSPAFMALMAQLERVGGSGMDVLVVGETGVGKELCARALHELSSRRTGPFVALNCAALTDELLLSELFGHERGAFTGAEAKHVGRFERAHGGTLFLDEIGDISPRGQAALLRATQERVFERVGGDTPVTVDVRIVVATNRNLAAAVVAKEFREDLYYRLCGVQVAVPSLRGRREDIGLLARAFLEESAKERGGVVRHLSAEAETFLSDHSWPGNIRELKHAMRAVDLLSESESVGVAHVRQIVEQLEGGRSEPRVQPNGSGPEYFSALRQHKETLRAYLDRVEREVIEKCLAAHGGNLAAAANELGLSRSRLSQIVHADPALRAQRAQSQGGAGDRETT